MTQDSTTPTTPVGPGDDRGFSATRPWDAPDAPVDEAAPPLTSDAEREQRIKLFHDQCDFCVEDLPDSLEELRTIQNDWEALDPEGARSYFKQLLNEHKESAVHQYLYGRTVKSRVEAVEHAREAIRLAPDWVYGYRLLMNIYGLCLFRHECPWEVQQKLAKELPLDCRYFEKVRETTPDDGALLGYVFDYYLYTGQTSEARAVIKQARRLKQNWALENDAPMLVKANEGKHKALKRYAHEMVHWRINQGSLSPKERDLAVMEYLVFLYRRSFGFHHAIDVLDQWKTTVPEEYRAGVYFDRARFLSLLNRLDEGFDSIDKAIELGFDNLNRAELHPCLLSMRADKRWPTVQERIRENWVRSYDSRKAEALAQKVDLPCPEFALPDLDDVTVRPEDLRGRIVILEFWATHCQPCRSGIPELSEFTRHDAGKGVRVFMVNVANENRQLAKKFIDIRRYKAHLLFADERIKKEFGVQMIPATVILDRNGRIRFREQGVHPGIRERLNWWIEDLAKEAGDGAVTGKP